MTQFTTELSKAITTETKQIDQKEREFTIDNAKVADIKNIIDTGITVYP